MLYNLTVKDNTGQVVFLNGVLNKNITNCSFENVTNSEVKGVYQFQIMIQNHASEVQLNQTIPYYSMIQNVSLNVRHDHNFNFT